LGEAFLNKGFRLDLLHKSEKGEAFADKNPDFTDKSGRKCFAPAAKNRMRARGLLNTKFVAKMLRACKNHD
jgi:hypothetical protein